MNKFPKVLLAEFWNDSAHIWIILESCDSFKNFRNQTLTYLRDKLALIPSLNFLKVPNGGLSERDGDLCHRPIAPAAFLLPSATPLVLTQDHSGLPPQHA